MPNFRPFRLAHAWCVGLLIAAASCPAPAAQPARLNLSGVQAVGGNDRFIVKYREGSPARLQASSAQQSLDRLVAARAGRGAALQLRSMQRTAQGANVVRANRRLDRVEAESLMRELAADPAVEYVELDARLRATSTPNDPRYAEQWGYSGTYGIRANQAWDVATGAGVVVGVVDTGITAHDDLQANVLPGYDFISDVALGRDGDGRDPDPADPGDWTAAGTCETYAVPSSWHGTHVAGTIAAVTGNGKGVAGVAPAAKILPVRALGACGGYVSDIADGVTWASGGSVGGVPANPNPAEVINLSMGATLACSITLQNAINGAVARGSTVVVAAGNDDLDAANSMPANCENVIVVGATDSAGARAGFSNHGARVDVAAPGVGILSTVNSGTRGPVSAGYGLSDGTSMAAPHVSGVVALMQSVAATPKTPAQVEQILKATTTPFPATPSRPTGTGIVNARAAVDAVRPTLPPPASVLARGTVLTNLSATRGATLTYRVDVPAGASNLAIRMSGGTGDGDLYIRRGSEPTDSAYDCRPYLVGNNETCTFAAPQAGTYYIRIKAYSAIAGVSLAVDYDLAPSGSVALARGTAQTSLAATSGAYLRYSIVVPAGATNLSIRMSGGTGDGDLYVKRDSEPTDTVYDCRPYLVGNNEACTFATPQAGTYYIRIKAYSAIAGVSLVADYTLASTSTNTLTRAVPLTNLSAAAGTWLAYTIAVPAGASNLTVRTSGGTGDGDLYVKWSADPTTTAYDCRPYISGNNETCTFAAPKAGTYFVRIHAYTAISGVTLVADYAAGG